MGWALGRKPLIDRLRQAKEAADLHTDQLSQAVLLEFAESGRLEAHRTRMLRGGRGAAGGDARRPAAEYLPPGTRWTRPEGGMNVWVRLPEPLDAGELLPRAQRKAWRICRAGISRCRGSSRRAAIEFCGLTPEQIRQGLAILGAIVRGASWKTRDANAIEPAPAMV